MVARVPKVMFVALFGAMLLTGCSGGSGSVKGVVTASGSPVGEATVTFHPTGSTKGSPFGGKTTADGKYTVPAGPNVVAGTYKVTVTKYEALPGAPQGLDTEQLVMMGKVKSVLPKGYARPDTTPIEVTVKSGANDIPIQVN